MSSPAFLFAHGAGKGSDSPWMQSWAERLSPLGPVRPFDYPYMAAGRRAPDRMPKLLAAHAAALDAFRAELPDDAAVFLVGKSMGSRVGLHLSQQPDVSVAGCVCLGYPLVGASKKRPVRRAVLETQRAPVLFVQGTRDRMGPLDLFDEIRAELQAPTRLHVVEAGDHSLRVTKTWQKQTGLTQEDADQAAFAAISSFVADVLS